MSKEKKALKKKRFVDFLECEVGKRGSTESGFEHWSGFKTANEFKNHNFGETPPNPYGFYDSINGETFHDCEEDADSDDENGNRTYLYRCVCGQGFDDPAYISHRTIPKLHIAVGQTCVKKILGSKSTLKRCTNCDKNYSGKERMCKNCRDTDCMDYQSIIPFGKYKGFSITEVKDERYFDWVLSQKSENRKFTKFAEMIVKFRKFKSAESRAVVVDSTPKPKPMFTRIVKDPEPIECSLKKLHE